MLKVVKIGGNIVDDPQKLDRFLAEFSRLEGRKILVHGGGKVATTICGALGIKTQMINGRRVTDEETMTVVAMVYGGLINKTIVNKLNTLGCRSVGLSGADGEFIRSKRRSPIPIDYGFVGDPVGVNTSLAALLSDNGYTIVAAPITADTEGGLLNTNADTVAQTIAVAMAQDNQGEFVELVYCFEKRGVLSDISDEDSVIDIITPSSFAELKKKSIVADGMLPKLENAFKALDSGVASVVICSAEALAEKGYGGTTIKN